MRVNCSWRHRFAKEHGYGQLDKSPVRLEARFGEAYFCRGNLFSGLSYAKNTLNTAMIANGDLYVCLLEKG